jgi:hypothetical protein
MHCIGEVEPVWPDNKMSDRPSDRTHDGGKVEPVRPKDDVAVAHGVVTTYDAADVELVCPGDE